MPPSRREIPASTHFAADARSHSECAAERKDADSGRGAQRRRVACRSRSSWVAGARGWSRQGSSVTPCKATSPFRGPSGAGEWNGWGNGSKQHTIRQGRWHQREGPAEAEAEVGLRFCRRDVCARAAGARRQPALHRERQPATCMPSIRRPAARIGSFRAQATVRTGLLVAPVLFVVGSEHVGACSSET